VSIASSSSLSSDTWQKAYNPHIFLRNASAPALTSNICSVVALGADDRSVSVWQTKSARPLIVAKEVFERHIMDLSWYVVSLQLHHSMASSLPRSWDGLTLYAASSDGTIGVFNFDLDELEGIAPHSIQEQYLQKFGFTPPPIPEGYSHFDDKSQLSSQNQVKHTSIMSDFGKVNGDVGERVNVLVAKRSNKKRANLVTTASTNGTNASVSAPPVSKRAQLPPAEDVTMQPPLSSSGVGLFPSTFEQPVEASDTWGHSEVGMDMDDVPIDVIDAKGKRKASNVIDLTEDVRPTTKARTLGGDRQRDDAPVKEIASSTTFGRSWDVGVGKMSLAVPAILTSLTAEIEGSDGVFEGKNSEDDGMYPCFLGCFSLILMRFDRIDRGVLYDRKANTVVGLSPVTCVGCESDLPLLCCCHARWFSECLFAYRATVCSI